MPGSNSPDFAATQLLADALSSQRGTLYAMVPEGKALYAGFQLSTLPEASLGYALAVFPEAAAGMTLVNEIKKILADDVKNGLPADLIEAVRRHEMSTRNSKGTRFPVWPWSGRKRSPSRAASPPTRIFKP